MSGTPAETRPFVEPVLAGGAGLSAFGMGLVIPVLPAFAATLGAGAMQVGLLFSASALASVAATLLAALLMRRVGRRSVLIGAPALTAMASLWCGLTGSFSTLLVFCMVEGATAGAYATAGTAALVAGGDDGRRTRSLAGYQGAILVGAAVGPVVGGLFGARRTAELFLVNAALAAFVAAWSARRLPREPHWLRSSRVARTGRGRALRSPQLLSLWVFVSAVAFAQVGAQWVATPYLGFERLGLDARGIGASLSVGGMGALAGLYPAGWFADRYGHKRALLVGGAATAIALFMFGVTTSTALFVAALGLLGVASALTTTAPPAHLAHSLGESDRDMGVGMYRTALGLGNTTGPLVIGWWIAGDAFLPAFVATGLLVCVSTTLLAWALSEHRT